MAYTTVNDLFKSIADAIRIKTGKTGKISSQDMPTEIASIETGGGSGGDDFEIANLDCFFHRNQNYGETWNNMDYYLQYIKQPKTARYVYKQEGSGSAYWRVPLDKIQKICDVDYSQCTSLYYFWSGWGINADDAGKTLNVNMDLSNCTSLEGAFKEVNYAYSSQYVLNMVFDFNGTTGKVSNFTDTFKNMPADRVTLEINNINMDRTGAPSMTFHGTSSVSNALSKLTFKGSFGALSTGTTMTIDLSYCKLYTLDALSETLTSIDENTSGKTRIFKLTTDLYNSITDEIWDLADEKLYELSC